MFGWLRKWLLNRDVERAWSQGTENLAIRNAMHAAFPAVANDYSLTGMDWVPDVDDGDAMEVVRHLAPHVDITMDLRHWHSTVVRVESGRAGVAVSADERKWVVGLIEKDESWAGQAETLGMAICRAALARCGVKLLAA